MKKLILSAIILMLIAAACWFVLAGRNSQQSSRSLALPDGTKLRVFAVTYGTNHTVGTRFGQFITDLPSPLDRFLKVLFGSRAIPRITMTTPTPELMVWVSRQTNGLTTPTTSVAYFRAWLGDGSNFISGQEAFMNPYMPGFETQGLSFSAFPRREQEMKLNVFNYDSKGVAHTCGSLSFANPLYRKYPEWQPEHLPAKKRVRDLEVTLDRFETGHGNSSSVSYDQDGGPTVEYSTDRSDGENRSVVYLKLRPLVNTNEVWQVAGVEISDATGNSTHNSGMSWSGGVSTFEFSPGLWPGEAAWKLKMEIKRTKGFRPEEIFTFKNVPLGELNRTNLVGWQTNVAGVTVTLASFVRRAPWTNNWWSSSNLSEVRLRVSSLTDGTQLDLLHMICDTGETNEPPSSSSSANEREYGFTKIPLAARTADFVFAIQQSRFVEFTAKPELPKSPATTDAPIQSKRQP